MASFKTALLARRRWPEVEGDGDPDPQTVPVIEDADGPQEVPEVVQRLADAHEHDIGYPLAARIDPAPIADLTTISQPGGCTRPSLPEAQNSQPSHSRLAGQADGQAPWSQVFG